MSDEPGAARLATDDEVKMKAALGQVALIIKDIDLQSPPPETAMEVYHIVNRIAGNKDPYRDLKKRHIRAALRLYPMLKTKVGWSADGLHTALRTAIAANIIDLGVNGNINIEQSMDNCLPCYFSESCYEAFRACLDAADEVLYIGENAGESVFDRILIEEMNKPVTYVVRSAPVINDVTYTDAVLSGIAEVTTPLPSGTDAPGTVLNRCSGDFKEKFYNSKFVISKGQGNFEALSGEAVPVFHLLVAICPIVARDIGARVGDLVLQGPGT